MEETTHLSGRARARLATRSLWPVVASLIAGCGADDMAAQDSALTSPTESTSDTEDTSSDSGAVGPSYLSFRPSDFELSTAERIIVLGDSVGYGDGASREQLTFAELLVENEDERWPTESGHDLTFYLGDRPNLVNVAVGGSTASAMASAQLPEIERRLDPPVQGHSLVIISVGGNDVIPWMVDPSGPADVLVDSVISDIERSIDFFDDQRFPDGVTVILNSVYDPTDGTGEGGDCFQYDRDPSTFEHLRDAMIDLGMRRRAAVADTLSHFRGHGLTAPDGETLWFSDCVHPDDRGHHEIRRMIFELVDPTHPFDVGTY